MVHLGRRGKTESEVEYRGVGTTVFDPRGGHLSEKTGQTGEIGENKTKQGSSYLTGTPWQATLWSSFLHLENGHSDTVLTEKERAHELELGCSENWKVLLILRAYKAKIVNWSAAERIKKSRALLGM